MHAGYKNVCIKVYFLKSNYALCCCVDYLCENNNEMGTTLIDGVIRGCGEDSLHLFSAPLSTVQFGGGGNPNVKLATGGFTRHLRHFWTVVIRTQLHRSGRGSQKRLDTKKR